MKKVKQLNGDTSFTLSPMMVAAVAAIAILAFILLSQMVSFTNGMYSYLFPTNTTQAATDNPNY